MLEYEAEAAAVRAKTARLRALRLDSEAAAGVIVAAQPKAKTVKRKKKATGTLSDWLKDQAKDGR